uniref:Kelch like family member 4 n=1 Tax=Hippocampus comes TaxID=109280 RepID=A0A3Q2YSY4_HIPCM
MNGRRLQFGVAVIDNKLYVVGGRDGLKTSNMVECYNPVNQVWSTMPPMSTPRHGLGIAVLEGPMYAVGGHDGWSYLNTVERWDPQARQWNYVASMSTPRSTMGVTALNGKLFAVGGRDGSSCLRSMECFDPHTNKWSRCGRMAKRRGGVGVATYNNFLYAVGGHDAPASNHCSQLSDCECYTSTFWICSKCARGIHSWVWTLMSFILEQKIICFTTLMLSGVMFSITSFISSCGAPSGGHRRHVRDRTVPGSNSMLSCSDKNVQTLMFDNIYVYKIRCFKKMNI